MLMVNVVWMDPRVTQGSLGQMEREASLDRLVKMEDLDHAALQENLASGAHQALPAHPDRGETQATLVLREQVDPRDLQDAKDQGEFLEHLVKWETPVPEENKGLKDQLAPLENLDSLVGMERLVWMVHLELQENVVKRVQEVCLDSREMTARLDNEEGLGQEVPLETVDQWEQRAAQEKMEVTANVV